MISVSCAVCSPTFLHVQQFFCPQIHTISSRLNLIPNYSGEYVKNMAKHLASINDDPNVNDSNNDGINNLENW